MGLLFLQEINKSADIKVRDLQIVDKKDVDKLKEGEIEKTKTYSALCWSKDSLSEEQLNKLQEVKDLVIYQKTPIRVLHRRPLATRERIVYSISAEKIDDLHFTLSLSTQAGTYIKEFVHGDFGRTTPNLGTLTGVECDILELDVQSVELDWPPSLEES
ncbi:tRNA pseudouridine synthase Pus10-like [Saccostrea cucullata]|uniref:tRNA pseudouridine synthase Pus10-like n=1 Tax=Saccostrea cuccullata TaxID=36930 RepID=UPI002ED59798